MTRCGENKARIGQRPPSTSQTIASAAMSNMNMITRRQIWFTPEPHTRRATPSGSFSSNHVSAASAFCEHLEVVDVTDLGLSSGRLELPPL
jgi:hypothetical protein